MPLGLSLWTGLGLKVYVYSSAPRRAQADFFENTTHGDLRGHLSGYFDPKSSGGKKCPDSYADIALSLGVSSPSQVTFLTDSVPEAEAAEEAGMKVRVVLREGNETLPEGHGFECLQDFTKGGIGQR